MQPKKGKPLANTTATANHNSGNTYVYVAFELQTIVLLCFGYDQHRSKK